MLCMHDAVGDDGPVPSFSGVYRDALTASRFYYQRTMVYVRPCPGL